MTKSWRGTSTVVGIDHPVEEIRIQVMYLATDLISTGT